jgi:predicted phage tail protein
MADSEFGQLGVLSNDPVTELIPVTDASLLPNSEVNMDELPTYHWNGATMKQKIGDVLPIVYGRHLVAPYLINAYIEEGENETLNLLLAWCEGEIESISNIKIGGNPSENFFSADPNDPYGESTEITVRTGSLVQEPIQHFDELHNQTVVGEVLKKDVPILFGGTVTTARAIKLEFGIDKLYLKALDNPENLLSWYIGVRVEMRKKGDAEYQNLGVIDINKKTTTYFKRWFKTEYLEAGQYELKITKVSDDQDTGYNPQHFGEITLITIDEITTEELMYPAVALTSIRLLAFKDLKDGVPNITGIITGRKIRCPKVTFDPSGNDPVDWEQYYFDSSDGNYHRLGNKAILYWDGVTYHEQWCGNPVWCLRDLLLNKRYGLGDFIDESKINNTSFLAVSQYCEEPVENDEGEYEKRFMLDCVIDSAQSAPDFIGSILKSFRGILYNSEGTLRLNVEKQETVKAIFNMGNILAESFSMQYLSKKKPNVISATFTNKDKEYARDSIEIAFSAQELADVVADTQSAQWYGVTRLTQILRESRILLNKINNNTRVINFSAYYDAVLLQPYDVIEFQHDVVGWGDGGRVAEGNTDQNIILDMPVMLEPTYTYKLKIRNPNTDELEERTVTNIAGIYTSLTVDAPYSFVPQENALWQLNAIGGAEAQKYRITKINKDEDGRTSISAIEHNDDVYDPTELVIPQDKYVHLIMDIPKVQNLKVEEIFNKLPSGGFESRLSVSFKTPPVTAKYIKQARSFEIWISDNEGASWDMITTTDREYVVIPEIISKGVLYTIAVISVTENGEKNPIATSPQQTIVAQGYVSAPSKVANLQFKFTDEIELSWDKNDDTDIIGYEIRTNDTGWLSDAEGLVWRGDAQKFIIIRPTARSGVIYYVRAINSQNIVSTQSATVEPINPRPNAPSLFAVTLFQKGFLSWLPVTDADLAYYEIWQNSEPVFFGIEQNNNNERIYAQHSGTNFSCEVPYDKTYYRICAVDKFGRGYFSNIVEVQKVDIASGDIGLFAIQETNIAPDAITTPKIRAGSIISGHISAKAIVADNIDVAQLSAISADLGTVRSGNIIGATIKTSEELNRLEMDSFGLRAYDLMGRKTVDLAQGQIRFINPDNPDYYSFLDSGSLVFHTPYGDMPYATRLCAGVATAGQRVCLQRWLSKPEVILGIKRLMSYDKNRGESSQEWCVFADNISYYDYGGGNFGWAFDVRAKLVISGGTRAEQFYDVPFGTTRCTGTGVCQIQVGVCLNAWCHQESPDPICYACICYEIAYRPVGGGAWTRVCFDYLQPHTSAVDIKCVNRICHTVTMATVDQWEVSVNERGRHYIASPYASGGYIPCVCCCYYYIDCSYNTSVTCYSAQFQAGVSVTPTLLNRSVGDSQSATMNFPAFDYTNKAVISTRITYCVCACALVRLSSFASSGSAYVGGAFGGGISKQGDMYTAWMNSGSFSWSKDFGSYQQVLTAITAGASMQLGGYTSGYDYAQAYGAGTAMQVVCFKCCCQCQYVCRIQTCVWLGGACYGDTKIFASMREIVAGEAVLDPNGEINYLAVAYR